MSIPMPGDPNYRQPKNLGNPPQDRRRKVIRTVSTIERLQAATTTQKGILDAVAAKLVEVLRIAQDRRAQDVEAWDSVLEVLRKDRHSAPHPTDDLQAIIDYNIAQAVSAIVAGVNADKAERKRLAFLCREAGA